MSAKSPFHPPFPPYTGQFTIKILPHGVVVILGDGQHHGEISQRSSAQSGANKSDKNMPSKPLLVLVCESLTNSPTEVKKAITREVTNSAKLVENTVAWSESGYRSIQLNESSPEQVRSIE